MEKNKKSKPPKDYGFPRPEPGKYKAMIDCTLEVKTQDIVNRQISINTMPRIASLLHTIGMDELATLVVEEEKKDVDIPAKQIVFVGELAVAVASAKNETSPIAKMIAKINAPVPEPLFMIANTIGNFEDPVGRKQVIENCEQLAVVHFITAGVCTDTFSKLEDIEHIITEAHGYTPYPTDLPTMLVPCQYLDSERCLKAMNKSVRVTSPTFSMRKSQAEKWTESFRKHYRQTADNSFMSWILKLRETSVDMQKTVSNRNLINLCVSVTGDKQPMVAKFAESISDDKFYGSLGIIEIPKLLKTVKSHIKTCRTTIGRQLSLVFRVISTKELAPDGSEASLTSFGDDSILRAPYKLPEEQRDIAFIAKFKQKLDPTQIEYKPGTLWNIYTTQWLKSFIKEDSYATDVKQQ